MYSRDYKERALYSLSGRWFSPVMVNIIAFAIVFGISIIFELLPQLSVLQIIITAPLYLGVIYYFVQFTLNTDRGIEDMFFGFNYLWGKSIVLYFFTGLFTLLWFLCFIIPGIIKAYAYSMAPYIMSEKPHLSAFEALDESQRMMEGYKWALFKLGLSFIGWVLLCIITFGIAAIWVIPYLQAATAEFYHANKFEK